MTKNEMTSRDLLNTILKNGSAELLAMTVNGQSVKDKCALLIAKMDADNAKKRATPTKETEAHKKAEPIRKAIMDFLSMQTHSVTESEIAKAIQPALFPDVEPAKVGAKIRPSVQELCNNGMVDKLDFGRNKPLEYKAK